jgi:hypothetical protein
MSLSIGTETWYADLVVYSDRDTISKSGVQYSLSLYVELIEKSLKLHIHDPKRQHYAIYVQILCRTPLNVELMHVCNHISAKHPKPFHSRLFSISPFRWLGSGLGLGMFRRCFFTFTSVQCS